MSARYWVLAAAVCSCSLAIPASLQQVRVEREGRRFHLVADAEMEATATAIYDVLVDYDDDRFGQISEIYKESGYLAPDDDGTPIVYTLVEGCLVVFCRSMRRVERLEAIKPRFIRTTALPERSDFKYSQSEWVLVQDGDVTSITYQLTIEPDFWLPPFVGPWYLKRILQRGGIRAVARIEELANQRASGISEATGAPTELRTDARDP